ncbi:MAG: Asp-tRNA(Asn)/Glu-tRNA(Gln) amidotransferase subunit GatC [Candidatus Yanofskybacteria bacterium]|nr:Asp-tRNA(Asn)/Glu-tRNA(Gln) amidotransferase subunit GatC [Candidatus Yanofskybacteria bacterium]
MISKDQVERIAKLARISLTAQETERFQKELSEVLDYFEKIAPLDVSGVAPMTHPGALSHDMRADVPEDAPKETVAKLREAMAESQGGFLKVRSIFDHGR